jgi:hypothetical protein
MAEIFTSLTPKGYEELAKIGLINSVKYYSFGDQNEIYSVTAENNIIPTITGEHTQVTLANCGKADYNGIYPNQPVESEIIDTRSRVEIKYNRIDCDNEYVVPNLRVQVNINSWLNSLLSASYSFNMTDRLTQTIWDYVSASIQTLDLTTKNYKTVNLLTNTKFSYVPETDVDYYNYTLLSPKYVEVVNGKEKTLVNNTKGGRYLSPLVYTLSTTNVNGDFVNGTSGKLSLVPGNWGYWANGNFVSVETVENGDTNLWETIYPAVQIGTSYYYLPNNNVWNTTNGLIGYLLNMINVNGDGGTALNGLITQAILFFKTNGKLSDGKYTIPINFITNVVSKELNNITDVIGNRVSVSFVYDPNDITSDIVQLINT